MDVLSEVTQAIADLRAVDPRLHTALQLINNQLHKITRTLEPIEARSKLQAEIAGAPVDSPVVGYLFTPRTVRFIWNQVTSAVLYEMRKGTVWETSLFQFRSSNLTADIDALPVGEHTFLFKSINSEGSYSAEFFTVVVSIPSIPPAELFPSSIDNNVIIDWEPPPSVFEIDHYDIYRNDVYIGFVRSSFFTRFEVLSGTYIYRVIAVDIAGNLSANSEVSLAITQPPDYILYFIHNSLFTGIKVNCAHVLSPIDRLIAAVNTDQTWQEHFEDNEWETIQDQVNAGFPLYAQPATSAGTLDASYEEIVDFGIIFPSVIVTIIWNYNQFDSANPVQLIIKMASSIDGISYTDFESGASQLATSMRYLKFRLEFNAPADTSLIEIFELRVNLDVKRENDAGEIEAFAADSGGTAVNFNKAFKDIDAVVATVKATTSLKALVDFVDIPNPLGFKVLVFSDTGTRQNALVEWHARGIV